MDTFHRLSGDWPENLQKIFVYGKFPHQEIRYEKDFWKRVEKKLEKTIIN